MEIQLVLPDRFAVMIAMLVCWTGVCAPPAAAQDAGEFQVPLTREQNDDLSNWVDTIRDTSVDGGMARRVRNAERLVAQDWPQALAATLTLLDNADGSNACIPVCQAIASNPPPHRQFVPTLMTLLSDQDARVRHAAATALARFRDPDLLDRLAILTQDVASPTRARVAAVHAMSMIPDSRRAVARLIELLAARDGLIDDALYAALVRASGCDLGLQPEDWYRWWQHSETLSEAEWLARTLDGLRQKSDARDGYVATLELRLIQSYRQIYDRTPAAEQSTLLLSMMEDELPDVRSLALDLIRLDIGEGHLPGESVLAELRNRLTDRSSDVRRGVLNIMGHLRDPRDSEAIVDLLAKDRTQAVRLAAIETLGRLPDTAAIPALVRELIDPACLPCRTAAAKSLGPLCNRDDLDRDARESVVHALIGQYDAAIDNAELRIAIIAALAETSDERCSPILIANLTHPQADVRMRCVKGLRRGGNRQHLGALLPLLVDSDAGVRTNAALAVGDLGSEPQLGSLLERLDRQIEREDAVRTAVWTAFQTLWKTLPPADRYIWCTRLAAFPHHEAALLEQHLATLDPGQTTTTERTAIYRRLAELHDARRDFETAAGLWDTTIDLMAQQDHPDLASARIYQFRARLRSEDLIGAGQVLHTLIDTTASQGLPEIRGVALEYLQSAQIQPEEACAAVSFLRDHTALFDVEFDEQLDIIEQECRSRLGQSPPTVGPTPNETDTRTNG